MLKRIGPAVALLLASDIPACSPSAAEGDDQDLTSVTARSRTLEFVGTIYVAPDAADDPSILRAARAQAQTAFGPLRTSDMAVKSRELREIDTSTFVKRSVKVVGGASPREMIEVKYTYRDDAVVGTSYARRSSAPLALMSPNYRSELERVLRECTTNDAEARDFASTVWYVFEPKLSQCQAAIVAEQARVDADRASLADPEHEVPESQVNRLYWPITAKLGADKTNRGDSYPDYHRLYRGGVKPNKLVISLVFGLIDHGGAGGPSADYNWGELMTTLAETMDSQGGEWRVTSDGPDRVDLGSFKLSSGKEIKNASIQELVRVKTGGSSLGLSRDEGIELQRQLSDRIHRRWFTLERSMKVAVGAEAPRDFAVDLMIYWGAASDPSPHRFATKNSDVFLYNGHSSIGYGPLDPKNFASTDFPSTYQILWIDGCVSYNYYNKDYVPLKVGGTANLDLITNGIEAPAYRSGHAMGQFLSTLLNGRGASYRDLLLAARDTEALRVVDGELDNTFSPVERTQQLAIQR